MKQSISEYQFIAMFLQSQYKDNFTHDGLAMIYEYLECIDENYELDITAIACEYTESSVESIASDYNIVSSDIDVLDLTDDAVLAEITNSVLEYLNNHSSLVGYNDDIIVYANF